jgi:VCBS repeat-containing protein
MRSTVVGLLLSLFGGIVFAQTTVPNTFTAGTAAKASEVNANFHALATAIDNLESRVSKLEGTLTAADVAGTYAFASLEAETITNANVNVASSQGIVHHQSSNGTFTFNANGTFSFSAPNNSSKLTFSLNTATATETQETVPGSGTGTWSLSGKILTISVGGGGPTVAFTLAAGPGLFINISNSFVTSSTSAASDHLLLILMRTN